MASIYKRRQDKSKKRSCWYIGYSDEHGVRRTRKGFTDKGETARLAAKIEYDVMLRKRGVIDSKKESVAIQQKLPIENHLVEFESYLRRNNQNTNDYVSLVLSRVRKIVTRGDFSTLSCVTVEKTEKAVAELRDELKFGARTYNHYLQAISSFGNWLCYTRKTEGNPFRGIERMNTEVDIRHNRRALTSAEFQMLVDSARTSNVTIQCYDGETRARIYILSYLTGLRRKELARLTPSSFKLDEAQPILIVEAACSKHRKKDTLPLHPALVTMLREWTKDLGQDTPLFPKLAKRRTWLMVKKDLERVGIPYKTREGTADFHASGRHTYITELVRNGATLAEAKELARHSDVRTTMKYTHIGLAEQANALSKIRWECSGSELGVFTRQRTSLIDIDQKDGELEKTPRTERKNTKKQRKASDVTDAFEAEDTGFEPATGCPALHFQ